MSRISSYLVMSLALLSDEKEVMSAQGNHAFAIVCGKECYQNIDLCLKDRFNEIDELISEGKIEVDGLTIELDFFLGGDYKFLLLVLGMNAANSNYACIYCKIHKADRYDMSKPQDFYWTKCENGKEPRRK